MIEHILDQPFYRHMNRLTVHQQNMVAQAAFNKDIEELSDEQLHTLNGIYRILFREDANDGSE